MRSSTIADNDKIHLSFCKKKKQYVAAKAAALAQTSSIFQGDHLPVSKTI